MREPGRASDDHTDGCRRRDEDERWYLRLYVAGQSPKSLQAYANLKRLCDEHLAGRYEIEIVDLVQNPKLARSDDILAIPTLVRRLPVPLRRVIGDLSNVERVLVGLSLRPSELRVAEPAAVDSSGRSGEQVPWHDFTLYVNGASKLSSRAITDARHLCETYLTGRYALAVVDLNEQTAAAGAGMVVAAPTLMKNHPLPQRQVVGDISDVDHVLAALDITGSCD